MVESGDTNDDGDYDNDGDLYIYHLHGNQRLYNGAARLAIDTWGGVGGGGGRNVFSAFLYCFSRCYGIVYPNNLSSWARLFRARLYYLEIVDLACIAWLSLIHAIIFAVFPI